MCLALHPRKKREGARILYLKSSWEAILQAMNCLDNGFDEVCVVYGLPKHHRIKMRTSNIIERLNEEIRRRERVIRIFPNEEGLERLIGALQKEINEI
ncbi:MAG: transposase [Succinivibrionaceae bacterium]|nr:transposase [Succinivibrionaceae bacterium]